MLFPESIQYYDFSRGLFFDILEKEQSRLKEHQSRDGMEGYQYEDYGESGWV